MPELLEIVGQDPAVAQLQRAINASRMPHAFLFAGPEGVGRETTAVALAKTLLCEQPVSMLPGAAAPSGTSTAGRFADLPEGFTLRQACGHCRECRSIEAGSHGDVHRVYKELARYHDDPSVRSRVLQELGIDVIRSFLIDPAGRAAMRGRGKVFIVRQADLMSVAAQNALLKTLEEPPRGVTIILLCERPEQMLPTTLSRCWVVHFNLLPREFVTQQLLAGGIDAVEAEFWASFTGGSVGRSLLLAKMGIYELKKDVLAKIVSACSGKEGDLGEKLAGEMDKLADIAMKIAKDSDGVDLSKNLAVRQSAGAMLEIISSAYVDAIHLRCGLAGQGAIGAMVNSDQADVIGFLAQRFGPTALAEIIDQLSDLEQLLWRNIAAKIAWDNVVITCTSGSPLGMEP